MLHNNLHIPGTKYSAILDSTQSNNASWESMKEILQTKIYYEEQVSESCLDQISLYDARS